MESQTNEWKEEEIEREAKRIPEKGKGNRKTIIRYNQACQWDSARMDKLFQNRDDETVYGEVGGMAETQNQGHSHETMEKTENNLPKSKLSEQETQEWIQSWRNI